MLNIKKLIAASVLIFGINGILLAHADAPQGGTVPGSVDDPVITKSYFDQNIANKIADELAKQTFNEEKNQTDHRFGVSQNRIGSIFRNR